MTKNITKEEILRALSTAQKALEDLPPNIEGLKVGNILFQLDMAIEKFYCPVLDPEGVPDPIETEQGRFDSLLGEFKKTKERSDFTTLAGMVSCSGGQPWLELSWFAELLAACDAEFIRREKLYLTYEVEEERLALLSAGMTILQFWGDDALEEVKRSLGKGVWFGPDMSLRTLDEPEPGGYGPSVVADELAQLIHDPGDRKQYLQLSREPNFSKINKLFLVYYGIADTHDSAVYSYRFYEGSVYLCWKGVDLAVYNRDNVAWPHIVRQRNVKTGKTRTREKGNWASLSYSEQEDLREMFRQQSWHTNRDCYFSPLCKLENYTPNGKLWVMDGVSLEVRHVKRRSR